MHVLILIEVFGLAVLLWYALGALNRMGRATHYGIKWSAIFTAVGVSWRLMLLCSGVSSPDLGSALMMLGLAAGLIFNRRRASSCPCIHVSMSSPKQQEMGGSHATH